MNAMGCALAFRNRIDDLFAAIGAVAACEDLRIATLTRIWIGDQAAAVKAEAIY